MRRSSAPSQKFQPPFAAPLRTVNTPNAPTPPTATSKPFIAQRPLASASSSKASIPARKPAAEGSDGEDGAGTKDEGDAGTKPDEGEGEGEGEGQATAPPAEKKPAVAPQRLLGPPRAGGGIARPAANLGGGAPKPAQDSSFSTPARTRPVEETNEEPVVAEKYYSAVWCKVSNKKHKKWEGDCVLVVRGKSVTLLDMEGKELGKSSTIRLSDLQTLKEGQSLFIGGKEVEIMGTISQELYTSGKCFLAAATPTTSGLGRPSPAMSNPMKKVTSKNAPTTPAAEIVIAPRFDPNAPNALVMRRPTPAQLVSMGLKGAPVVDVVVDPYLSQHLRPHQREGVKFLYECLAGLRDFAGNGAILADDMGLGKTLQTITILWTLLKQGFTGRPMCNRAAIVCPSSLVKNWKSEFKKWLGQERLQVFAHGEGKTVQQFASATVYSVLIISYEMFLRSIKELQQVKFDVLICDEAHRLKNAAAKTSAAMASLNVKKRIALTGTPVQNDLQEFHAIVEFCNPGVLGSAAAFRRIYEEPIVACRQPDATPACRKIGQERASELNRLISLFCLRRTADVNKKYLPPKEDYVLFCPPSKLQLALYQRLITSRAVRSYFALGGVGQKGSRHLIIINALKKLCNTPALLYQGSEDAECEADPENIYNEMLPLFPAGFDLAQCGYEDAGKLAVLKHILVQLRTKTKERVLIVANSTKCLDRIQMMCEDQKFPFLRLEGSTPTAKRIPLVERFNRAYSDDFVFLLSSKAGGVGLNIVGASRLFLYDIDWNPANDLQAMARIWRDGQKRKVYVYRMLTTGTIEEKIFQRQVTKQGLSGAVVDDKMAGGNTTAKVEFSLEELKDLFSLREGVACETHDLLACTCKMNGERACTQAPAASSEKHGKDKDKDNTMDELMSWRHYSSSAGVGDAFVAGLPKDLVSFVFSNLTVGGSGGSGASSQGGNGGSVEGEEAPSLTQADLITADFLSIVPASGKDAQDMDLGGDLDEEVEAEGQDGGGDGAGDEADEGEAEEDEEEELPAAKKAKSSSSSSSSSSSKGKGKQAGAKDAETTPKKTSRARKPKRAIESDEEDESGAGCDVASAPAAQAAATAPPSTPQRSSSSSSPRKGAKAQSDEDFQATTYSVAREGEGEGDGEGEAKEDEDEEMIDLTGLAASKGAATSSPHKRGRLSQESCLSQCESLDADFGDILDGV